MKYAKYSAVLLVLPLLLSYTAFGQETNKGVKPEEKQMTHDHSAMQVKRVVVAMDADGVQRVEIVGGEYYFDPNYIVVKVNKPVEFKVKKATDSTFFIPHNIIVKAPEAGMDFNIDLKKEIQAVKFTPTKVGKYPVYCDKKAPFSKTHRDKGMEGTIEVVE
jgi:plastocyanin